MKKLLLIAFAVAMIFGAAQANATPYADWSISHSWPSDNQIWIGVGDPNAPLWETLVQSYIWNNSGTVDISGGSAYLFGNTWYLKAQDFVWRDSGSITNFQVRPGDGNTYVSTDHPGFNENTPPVYAYVTVPGNVVPEPMTLGLLGTGLLGLMGFRKKQS